MLTIIRAGMYTSVGTAVVTVFASQESATVGRWISPH